VSSGLRDMWTVARHELRVVRTDPFPVVVLIGMPLVVTVFITPAYDRAFSRLIPGLGIDGAVQSVPGMSVTFAFFVVAFVGFALFREHGWGTWPRLRAAPISPLALLVGKVLVPFVIIMIQHLLLFGFGIAFLGLPIRGPALAGVLVAASFGLCLVMLGMALSAFAGTVQQLNSVVNLSAVISAGLGGALTPLQTLPDWARVLSPITPTYWALRGYRAVILSAHGAGMALESAAVLGGFTLVFTALFLLRFRFDERKISWA
jgi:ABC-2 type transport system permease protein